MNNLIEKIEDKTLSVLLRELLDKIHKGEYRISIAANLMGITLKQITYWTDIGLIEAVMHGRNRNYSMAEITKGFMIKLCLNNGLNLDKSTYYTDAYYDFFFNNEPDPEISNCYLAELNKESIILLLERNIIDRLYLTTGIIEDVVGVTARKTNNWLDKGIITALPTNPNHDENAKYIASNLDFQNIFEAFIIEYLTKKHTLKMAEKIIIKSRPEIKKILANYGKKNVVIDATDLLANLQHSTSVKLANFLPEIINTYNSFSPEKQIQLAAKAFVVSCFSLIKNPNRCFMTEANLLNVGLDLMKKMTETNWLIVDYKMGSPIYYFNQNIAEHKEGLRGQELICSLYLLAVLLLKDKQGSRFDSMDILEIIKIGCTSRSLLCINKQFRLFPYLANKLRFSQTIKFDQVESNMISALNWLIINDSRPRNLSMRSRSQFTVSTPHSFI